MNQYLVFYDPNRKTLLTDATPGEIVVVEEHAAYLQNLLDQGRLVLEGRCRDAPPGIAIFEATDDAAAKAVIRNDPAVVAGVFRGELRPHRVGMRRGRR